MLIYQSVIHKHSPIYQLFLVGNKMSLPIHLLEMVLFHSELLGYQRVNGDWTSKDLEKVQENTAIAGGVWRLSILFGVATYNWSMGMLAKIGI